LNPKAHALFVDAVSDNLYAVISLLERRARGDYSPDATPNAEPEMCDKCVELDRKLAHYERLYKSISDQLTIDRINELVKQIKAQKAALHPEQE
jgi:hypothetical protein